MATRLQSRLLHLRLWACWTHPQHSTVYNRCRLLFRFCHNARYKINLLLNDVKHLNRIKRWSDDILNPKGQLQCEIIIFSKKCPVHYSAPQEQWFMDYGTSHNFHWHWAEQIMILSVWLNCSFNVILGLSPCLCVLCDYGSELLLSHSVPEPRDQHTVRWRLESERLLLVVIKWLSEGSVVS